MRISIFGMGYVGCVSAACLARDGHDVVGVDLSPAKLELIRGGKAPIVEEGIQELTREAVAAGRLTVTDNAAEAIARSELTFICVGTPSSRQRRPGPERGRARRRDHRRSAGQQAAFPHDRAALDGDARHHAGPGGPRAAGPQRAPRRAGLRAVFPAGVPARRQFDTRLRQAAVHAGGRRLGTLAGRRCAVCSDTCRASSSRRTSARRRR